jgi:hypothetical protein
LKGELAKRDASIEALEQEIVSLKRDLESKVSPFLSSFTETGVDGFRSPNPTTGSKQSIQKSIFQEKLKRFGFKTSDASMVSYRLLPSPAYVQVIHTCTCALRLITLQMIIME